MKTLIRRLGLSALAVIAAAGIAFAANDLTLSTGILFTPGPRLIDGADLNVMLAAVNKIQDQLDGTRGVIPTCVVSTPTVTPATCNGVKGSVTTNSLSTVAATDASYVINNSSVVATSNVQCTNAGYSGTIVTNGYPVIMTCVPGAGIITAHITNTHAANALAGTVAIAFRVTN